MLLAYIVESVCAALDLITKSGRQITSYDRPIVPRKRVYDDRTGFGQKQ